MIFKNYCFLVKQRLTFPTINLYNCIKFGIRRSSKNSKEPVSKKKKIDLSKFPPKNIRNFGIIAHVDHGKSTLSDRLLEFTGTVSAKEAREQFLDKLPVERERGITVKAQTSSMLYQHRGETFLLNLIDTPGHVDFSYEVLRSLSACGGALLLVDANQGIQAQTIANYNLAFLADLPLIPVLNKIDLKNAQPDKVASQVERIVGVPKSDILKVSAKMGIGIEELLQAIVEKIPSPAGSLDEPFRAHLFDSWHDNNLGVVGLIQVVDGSLTIGDLITSHQTSKEYKVLNLGIMYPEETPVPKLHAGQVGYMVANIRSISDAKLGDTFYLTSQPTQPLPLIEQSKPMVYAGVYPVGLSQLKSLEKSINRLALNDPSVHMTMDSNSALGQGWRLGFLGLLHMEVFCQRLEMEFGEEVVITAPSVPYKIRIKGEKNIKLYGSDVLTITNPLKLPDVNIIEEYMEPMVYGTIISPNDYVSKIYHLCRERRGVGVNTTYIDEQTSMYLYKFPLNEIIIDFVDKLKACTSGYASFDYEDAGYELSNLVKLEIKLNGEVANELTQLVPTSQARQLGASICRKLKESLPPHQFKVSIQAVCGKRSIARETLSPMMKDVTAKLYGGDVTRRMKLLKYQADGKEKMRKIGAVRMRRDSFIKVLQR